MICCEVGLVWVENKQRKKRWGRGLVEKQQLLDGITSSGCVFPAGTKAKMEGREGEERIKTK